MAIEDYLPANRTLKTGHPPSRVRKKLKALDDALQAASRGKAQFMVANGALLSTAQVMAEIAEAQAEWTRLDDLRIQAREQEKRIAKRAAAFMDFVVLIRMHLRGIDHKPRRPLTVVAKVLAAAKLRETRKLRHTMGSRQKKHIKA